MDDIKEFFTKLFSPDGWPARWHCGMWTPFHGWLYIISNIFIALAYFSIPVILFNLIRKTKNKLPFQRIFWLFLIFILACGFTHVFDALMFWYPIYRAAAVMLFITAVVSCAAVIGLYKIIPEALLLKSPGALEKIINERTEELVKTNQFLSATNAQLKEAQALSEKLLKEKDEFISVASHELKTPVTSLKAYTQVLTRQSANEDGAKKDMFIKMDTQINKLTKLINDLLDTTQLQNGSLAYQKEEIRLDKIIEEICEEIQMTTSHTIIQEKTEITVIGDKARISQAITNLLTNAIKFSPDAGEIIISLTRQGDNVVCAVKDFGFGIPKDEQYYIFDKFYRVNQPYSYTYPGLGLGLYIVKDIVQRHDGKIWVESEAGKGSTFYFSLPLTGIN